MQAMGGVGGGPQLGPAEIAIAEMKGMADCFAKMSDECYKKCIPNVKEAQMSSGEMSCVDRCVSKYLDTHAMVGQQLTQQGQQAQAAAQG